MTWRYHFPHECVEFLLLLFLTHLKVWSIILGNKRTVTLAQNSYLLLDVFYLIFCFFQIYNFNSHHLLCAVVDAFVNLPKGTFSNPLLFGEVLLGVQPGILATLEQRKEWNSWPNHQVNQDASQFSGLLTDSLLHRAHCDTPAILKQRRFITPLHNLIKSWVSE